MVDMAKSRHVLDDGRSLDDGRESTGNMCGSCLTGCGGHHVFRKAMLILMLSILCIYGMHRIYNLEVG